MVSSYRRVGTAKSPRRTPLKITAEQVDDALEEQFSKAKPAGIYWRKDRQKWQVLVAYDGRRVFLGWYANLDDAAKVVEEFRKTHPVYVRYQKKRLFL